MKGKNSPIADLPDKIKAGDAVTLKYTVIDNLHAEEIVKKQGARKRKPALARRSSFSVRLYSHLLMSTRLLASHVHKGGYGLARLTDVVSLKEGCFEYRLSPRKK